MIARKAQSANNAAILLILIIVIIVLYLLFLPPAERAILLGENQTGTPGSSGTVSEVVLRESVGRLVYQPTSQREYDLQSFEVKAFSGSQVLNTNRFASVRRSVFESVEDSVNFQAQNVRGNVLINFNANGQGRLIAHLNGEKIFDAVVEGNSPPIFVDNYMLKDMNTLTFSVDSPGIAFWRSNYYEIDNLQIVGDVQDFTRSENRQTFVLNEDDLSRKQSSSLRFVPNCIGEVGNLDIRINYAEVYRGVPDCNVPNTIFLNPDVFEVGTNFIDFKIQEGEIIFDGYRIRSQLGEPQHPIYYFDIKPEEFRGEELRRKAELRLDFPNPDRKRLEIFINGRLLGGTLQGNTFERDISEYLQPYVNSIEIRPLQTVDITQLTITLR